MKILSEKKKEYYQMEFEMSEGELEMLAEYGLEKIKDDKNELVNYAVNLLLKEFVEDSGKIDTNDKK